MRRNTNTQINKLDRAKLRNIVAKKSFWVKPGKIILLSKFIRWSFPFKQKTLRANLKKNQKVIEKIRGIRSEIEANKTYKYL
jgi:uncharacterized coiled-coil DUF342 family protein